MVPMGAGPPSPGGDPDGYDGGNNSQYPSASGSSGNTPTPPNDEERESNEEPPPPYEDPYWGNGDRHSDYQPLGTQDQSLYLGLQHDGNDGLPPLPTLHGMTHLNTYTKKRAEEGKSAIYLYFYLLHHKSHQ